MPGIFARDQVTLNLLRQVFLWIKLAIVRAFFWHKENEGVMKMKITRWFLYVILLIVANSSIQLWGEADNEGHGFIKWDIRINDTDYFSPNELVSH